MSLNTNITEENTIHEIPFTPVLKTTNELVSRKSLHPSREVIRMAECVKKTGLPTGTIYRLMKEGKFPKNHKLFKGARCSGWFLSEIEEFLNSNKEKNLDH
jgi:predicted DNA-binding transcriptional regulator AlpA